jgi:hypothetical protein
MAAGAVQVILLDPALGPNTMFIGRPTVASGARPTGASSLTSFRNVKLAAALAVAGVVDLLIDGWLPVAEHHQVIPFMTWLLLICRRGAIATAGGQIGNLACLREIAERIWRA